MPHLGAAWRNSTVRRAVATTRERVGRAVSNSWLLRADQRVSSVLGRATAASAVGRCASRLALWTRHSAVATWLASEPDAEAIVVDLRKTWTVGPVLAVLDRTATVAASLVRRTPLQSVWSWTATSVRAAPVRALATVVLVAVVTEAVLAATTGTLTRGGLGRRLVAVGLALLVTRVHVSWAAIVAGAPGRFVRAVFEPPTLPDDDAVADRAEDGVADGKGESGATDGRA